MGLNRASCSVLSVSPGGREIPRLLFTAPTPLDQWLGRSEPGLTSCKSDYLWIARVVPI